VRSDIIWAKPNPMPESCTDRPTSAHEHVFLLTKRARYFYDADAVREPQSDGTYERFGKNSERSIGTPKATTPGVGIKNNASMDAALKDMVLPNGRNLRNVWTLSTESFSGAHFATFPSALAERCIKAGTSERGCCAACGAPWVRQLKQTQPSSWEARKAAGHVSNMGGNVKLQREQQTGDYASPEGGFGWAAKYETTGWSPSCTHDADVVPCTILDPFAGAGTSLLVADRLQRHAIGIDLNTQYAELARNRIEADCPLFTSWAPADDPEDERMADLFADDEYQQIPTPPPKPLHVPSGWDTGPGAHGTIHRNGRTMPDAAE
jgi:hypothetical protein